jgi:hypothetical protein
MISKQNKIVCVLFCILFCILYFFIAAKPLEEHLHLQPVWTTDITQNISAADTTFDNKENLHHFKLGQNLGYFDTNGNIILFKTFPFKATISNSFFTLYTPENASVNYYNPHEKLIATIPATGFPFFNENRLYVFHPGGNSFSAYNEDGSFFWSHDEPAIITAFDSSENGTVAGYSNGKIFYTDAAHVKSTIFSPGGSNYEIIYGLAISPDGKYVAALCGLDKQRIIVAQIEERQTKIIFNEFLDSETTNQSLVYFSNNNEKVFINTRNNLVVVNIKTLTSTHLNLQGNAVQIAECKCKQKEEMQIIYAVLSKITEGYTVSFINNDDVNLGNFDFDAQNACLTSENNSLFIGKDTSLSRIDLIND